MTSLEMELSPEEMRLFVDAAEIGLLSILDETHEDDDAHHAAMDLYAKVLKLAEAVE